MSYVHHHWRKLQPDVWTDTLTVPNQALEVEDIVRILHELQLSDIEEVLAFHDNELLKSGLSEVLENTSDSVQKMQSTAQQMQDLVFDKNPSLERSLKFF